VDDSFHNQQRSRGFRFIIWDGHISVIGSGAGKIGHYNDALQNEAMVALHGLLFAIDADISNMEMEIDAYILETKLTSSFEYGGE
jgi:succinyl-CoA synthetase beta subunit